MAASARSEGSSPRRRRTGSDARAELPPIERTRRLPQKSSFILAETIMQDIVRERLKPGDALPAEKEMVDRYGMGRTTVREALRLLEYQGAIQIRQGLGGGPYVQTPNSSHFASTIIFLMQMQRTPFKSIVEVRTALEPMICRLAAERISDEALAELTRTVTEMHRIVDDREQSMQFSDLNTRFHNVIAWSSDNALFRYLADSLLDIMDGAIVGLSYSERNQRGVISAHEAILAALNEHDGDAAFETMTKHLAEWETYARRRFPDALEQSVPWTWTGSGGYRFSVPARGTPMEG
ncbi:FCD domain-containing protein [Dactylosporangium sp. NPDC000244]|uniref:FadR/GntR family transcriptional regulator n=1 Tax=Dactylosporangium sp. NPDC000244 TaxID=3154365 RepID=UPI003331C71B